MLRRFKYRMAGAALHHLAVLDHDHVMGHGAHHRQVMADEQVGQAVFSCNSRSNATTCFCTVRSSAEVGSSSRISAGEHQRPGDGDALALAAGKLVG
jgi:hypothetical protein